MVPTVSVSTATPGSVPTLTLPQATPTPTPLPLPTAVHHRHPKKHHSAKRRAARPKTRQTWITAFLTSYCPGSAGWLSSSGLPVFYGMLANNYYPFGTRVYIPVIGLDGVVEDHMSPAAAWYQFDVWSAICYSTPTGYYPVAVRS